MKGVGHLVFPAENTNYTVMQSLVSFLPMQFLWVKVQAEFGIIKWLNVCFLPRKHNPIKCNHLLWCCFTQSDEHKNFTSCQPSMGLQMDDVFPLRIYFVISKTWQPNSKGKLLTQCNYAVLTSNLALVHKSFHKPGIGVGASRLQKHPLYLLRT